MALQDFRAVFMPYCLQKQPDCRYAVLNREYKPVGFYTTDWIDYAKHPVLVRLKGLTKAKAAKLSVDVEVNVDLLYLYDDETNPVKNSANMRAYLEKLEMLASLGVG